VLACWGEYDACGRKTYDSYPFAPSSYPKTGVTYALDGLDRLKTKTNPDGSAVSYQYDQIFYAPPSNYAQLTTITDEETHVTKQLWVAFGDPRDARLASATEPGSGSPTTEYAYNALGSLTEVSPGSAAKRSWHYNAKNQLDQEVHPESGTVNYTYYPAGNLKTRVDPAFGTTAYGYDANERLTSIDRPGTVYDTTLGYDGSDNRTLLQNGHVTSTMGYDGANRLDWRIDNIGGLSFTTDNSYDGNDNLTRIDYPSGRAVINTYDTAGRVTKVTDGGGATYADQFQYHPSGAPLQFKPGGSNAVQQFSYDGRYRLYTSTTGHRSLTHTYDDVGNLTTLNESSRPGRNRTFGYDELDRLRTATGVWGSASYDYNTLGDRTSSTVAGSSTGYSYSGATNRLGSTSGSTTATFGYDDNGNLTMVNGVATYSYTPENMLETGGGATYRYDGDNLRKSKIVGADKHYYIHGPGGQILSEMTSATCRVRDSIYAGSRLIATLRPASPTVELVGLGVLVGEAQGTVTPEVELTTSDGCVLAAPVSVSFATADGEAKAGLDYIARTGSVTFPAGSASGSTLPIDVTIINDDVREAMERFQMTLTGATGATLGARASQPVTIMDDDSGYLSVSRSGTGAGTVTSSPSGIACGTVCGYEFDKGTVVTLTALAEPGSTFMGWGGACSGIATCTLTMDVAKEVTARFDWPTLSIGDATIREGPSGTTKTMEFTVTLTAPVPPAGQGAQSQDKAVPEKPKE
jgi:YD repeat-containing protein